MVMYGVTWANRDHSVAQTGYVFATIKDAERAARKGPHRIDVPVNSMCSHFPATCGVPMFGLIQTPDDTIAEVRVRRGNRNA